MDQIYKICSNYYNHEQNNRIEEIKNNIKFTRDNILKIILISDNFSAVSDTLFLCGKLFCLDEAREKLTNCWCDKISGYAKNN